MGEVSAGEKERSWGMCVQASLAGQKDATQQYPGTELRMGFHQLGTNQEPEQPIHMCN